MDENKRLGLLNLKLEERELIKQMCETPGFKLLQREFEEKIKKATNLIIDMNTPDDTVRSLRQKILVWTEIISVLKSLVHTGNCAARILRDDLLELNTPAN